jgi:Cu/Ag efflux pump CusA
MLRWVLAAALRFRLLLVGVAAGMIVLGALSLRQMHDDVLPELASGPVLEVQTEALGLSSSEVEQYVTVPMENNLLDGIMGVWDVRSHSIPSLSSVDLYFQPGTTVLHARQLVEERLTNAFSLPNVSKPPLLIQPLSSTGRVMMIGLSSTAVSPLELSYLARWVIKPRLSGVQGVANVSIFGQQDRQIQVQVDPARLASRRLQLSQIIATAGNAQLVSPLGYLQGSAPGTGGFLDGPNQRLDVRPVLPLGAPRDLAAAPISGAPGHEPLGQATTVVQGHQPLIGDAVVGGGSGLVLEVQKLPGASVVGVTHGLERALSDLAPALAGVRIDSSFFQPAGYVSDSLHNLVVGLLIAAALALVAIFALFLDLRPLAVGALAVGLSLLAATLVLQGLGYTFNALVILGLLIAATVVVDDAIGATGEIVRRVREREGEGGHAGDGEPAETRASIETTIVEAVLGLRGTLGYATLVTLLCIAPVFFAKGLTATFVHPMLLAFALAVLASMVVAVTFTPALAMLIYDRGRPRWRAAEFAMRIGGGYERVMRRVIGVPRAALAGLCVAGLVGLVVVPFLHQPAPPRFKDRDLVVAWDGPAGTSLAEMGRITRRVIGQLRSLPLVSDTAATLGRAVGADQIVDPSSGQIYVALKSGADYNRAVAEIREIVGATPGIRASLSTYEADVMNGVLAPADDHVTVRVYGEDYRQLRGLASRVQGLLGHVAGLGAAEVALPAQEPNIEIAVDDQAALRAGVLPGDARRQASTLVSGLTVGNFFQAQAVFDVTVIGLPSVRSRLDEVRNLLIDTSGGGHVRLDSIAQVSVRPDPIDVQHDALSRFIDVSAPVRSGSVGAAGAAIGRRLPQLSFPRQYHAEIVGGTPEDPTGHVTLLSYVLAAAVGMLLLFQAALASWRLAAALMLVLPLSLAGGLLVALATGETTSLGADAGLLALFVLAARQGMLQLALIRRRHREDGGELTADLVVRAAAERLGPSLGAAAVIAVSMVPFVVIGNVAGNEITHVAAAVILGGLVSTTLLSQIMLPALCLALGPTGPTEATGPSEATEATEPSPRRADAAGLATPTARVLTRERR